MAKNVRRPRPLCRSLVWLASGLVACVVLSPVPALAQGFVPGPLTAEVRTLERCLDVPGGNTADQLRLQMFSPCHGGSNQRWLLRSDFSGFVILESESTHKCLDVPNTSTVQQFRCHGGDNQRWQLSEDPETLRFRLRPKTARDRCLHVADDNRMDLVACDNTPGAVRLSRGRWERQNFEIRLLPSAATADLLINEDRQWCLDVQGLSQNDGAVVQTFPCNSGGNQLWRFVREANGMFFSLRAEHSRKCLRRTANGVDQAACDPNQDRQKWFPQLTSTGRVKLQTKEPACHLIPGPNDITPRNFCQCLNALPDSQALRVTACSTSADLWRIGTGRWAPGALTFFEDNGVRGDRLCGLPPAAGEYRFEEPGARACENDEARSLLLYEIAGRHRDRGLRRRPLPDQRRPHADPGQAEYLPLRIG
ncbi:MAG TPA: RICIN domain-containing protein [Thermoanaerobaculia bacterium]|jgi:hypothetical protein|nr:RICIN domain-containing protein [Thermoanaerobaculia bacterium]